MKRKHSSDASAPALKRAKPSPRIFPWFRFVRADCVADRVTSAAQANLIPYDAMHAVCAIIQRTQYRVPEYQDNSIPAITLVNCGSTLGTANRCAVALRVLRDVYPFSYAESSVLAPSWVDVVKSNSSTRETLVIREVDMQYATALGTASIIRETVGRVSNPASVALNICHRWQRYIDLENNFERQAVHNIWAYVGGYLIASAEAMDTVTPRFLTEKETPVWKKIIMKKAPEPELAVRIGDLGACDPYRSWPMAPQERKPDACDYRYQGMCEPTRKASATILSRIPDLIMVMLSAGHLLHWPSNGAASAADNAAVLDTVIGWIHSEILGGEPEASTVVPTPPPTVDVFSRVGRITVRHAVLCMVLGSAPHVICDSVVDVLYHLCALIDLSDKQAPLWATGRTVSQWIQTTSCRCRRPIDRDEDSDSESGESDSDRPTSVRIWHDLPESVLQAIYALVFDPVAVPTTILAMRIIDGIRLRNPPPQEDQPTACQEKCEKAAYVATVDRSWTLEPIKALAHTRRVRPDVAVRSLRVDRLGFTELSTNHVSTIWKVICNERVNEARALRKFANRSTFLTDILKGTPADCMQAVAKESYENIRHAWYVRTAVVAALCCAYELLGCFHVSWRLRDSVHVCVPLRQLISDSKRSAYSIATIVANSKSASEDYQVAPEFLEHTGDMRTAEFLRQCPSLVCSLPVVAVR